MFAWKLANMGKSNQYTVITHSARQSTVSSLTNLNTSELTTKVTDVSKESELACEVTKHLYSSLRLAKIERYKKYNYDLIKKTVK